MNTAHLRTYTRTPMIERAERWIERCPMSGCWLWFGATNPAGYGVMNREKGASNVLAHRFMYEHHHGQIPGGLLVCHKCDTPACVNPRHLFLGTHRDNGQDMARKGRGNKPPMPGSTNPIAKLTEDQVVAIRAACAGAKRGTQRRMSEKYNVSEAVISAVVRRARWQHV